MTVKFTNNASTTVATGINTTATSLVVASAAGFPALSGSGDYCYLTIQQAAGTNVEVVKATALSSNTFTIVRAQDGTSAGSWSVSDVVELRVTAALLTDIVDAATHDASVLSVDSTNNRVGVNDTTPSVTLDISGTDAIALPVGTTAQRPSAGAGRFRYNSSLSQFEGYTDAWGAIGGGGTNTFTTDSFTANGSLVAFNLSQTVASESNLLVFIDGVFQTQDAYAIATASGTTTLTFSAAPANARKIVVYSVAAGISGTNLNVDSMTGDGSDVTLTLTINTIKENTQVFIDGVYQAKANYSISGTTLTFSTAPPAGSAVECVTMTQTEINVPVDGTITSAKLSGALTTPAALTVTGALAANGGAVFNEGGADVDFRVESDVNTHGLFVQGSDGKVGLGISNPSDYYANNLVVGAGAEGGITIASTSSVNNGYLMFADSSSGTARYAGLISYEHSTDNMVFRTNTLERMRIDSSGNVLTGGGTASASGLLSVSVGNASGGALVAQDTNGAKMEMQAAGGLGYLGTTSNHPALFLTNNTERMRIDSVGNVGIGAAPQTGVKAKVGASGNTHTILCLGDSSGYAPLIVDNAASSGNRFLVSFRINNVIKGNITSSGSVIVYGGTSDYRLKENVITLTGATDRLKQLRPKRFNFIGDTETIDGFLAHEVDAVVPVAVVGEKDAVDENGDVDAQQMDNGLLVPLLVATIQELEARLTALENN